MAHLPPLELTLRRRPGQRRRGQGRRRRHRRDRGRFELNDLFGVFFALPSILLIYLGTHGSPLLLAVGLGMTAYGAIYFGFHDVIVHRRLPHRLRFSSAYLQRIIKAHHIHHATRERDGAVSFGFIYAPPIEVLTRRG